MPSSDLPSLTPETIQRAREGLYYACARSINQAIETALSDIHQIADGKSQHFVHGNVRKYTLRRLIHTLFEVKVEYPENIPQNAAILAANHLNHLDPFLLLCELPESPYYYILGDARTLYNKWWKRRILKLASGVIPLQRRWGEELAVLEAVKKGYPELQELANAIEHNVPAGGEIRTMRMIDRAVQQILTYDGGIILFPEGRLGKTEGQLMLPLKRGIAVYALRSGIPIVPVALIGTQNLYLKKKLTVCFGKPLNVPQSLHPTRQEINSVIEQLETALQEILPTSFQESDGLQLFNHFLNHLFC